MRGKDYPKIGPASIPASIHQGEDSRAGRDEMLLGLAITPLPEKHITNLAFLAAIKSCFHAANMSHSVLYLMSWAEFFSKGAKKIQANAGGGQSANSGLSSPEGALWSEFFIRRQVCQNYRMAGVSHTQNDPAPKSQRGQSSQWPGSLDVYHDCSCSQRKAWG